jgi:hypothetical protein
MTHLADILARQRAAFMRDGAPDLARRRADLAALRRAIASRRGQIEAAISADFGHRSRHETALMEICPTVQGIAYLSAICAASCGPNAAMSRWTFRFGPRPYRISAAGRHRHRVAPWNYPVSLAMMPLATALAAGNRVMIKPSEYTPHTSGCSLRCWPDVSPRSGRGRDGRCRNRGKPSRRCPLTICCFTGSTAVGKAVMRAASENLVPVTLELGGKSPVIMAPGAVDAGNVTARSPLASWPMPARPASPPITRWFMKAIWTHSARPMSVQWRACILTVLRARIIAHRQRPPFRPPDRSLAGCRGQGRRDHPDHGRKVATNPAQMPWRRCWFLARRTTWR